MTPQPKKAAKKDGAVWVKHTVLRRKKDALRIKRMLTAPGLGRVGARIVREIYYRVEIRTHRGPRHG